METSNNIPNQIQAIIPRIMKWKSINVTFVETKEKGRTLDLHFIVVLHNFLSGKKKVCRNKYSANEAPITPEMSAETHVHVVINHKCVFFDNLIKTEMRRPVLVELPINNFV